MKRSQRPVRETTLDMVLSTSVSSRLPRFLQRLLQVGPRYGIARGIVLFGPEVHGDIDPATSLLQPAELSRWLTDRNESCDNTCDALATVERRLPEILDDEELGHMLGNELGLLLGQVLIATAVGARWAVWPNGHPVIQIGRTDLDVTDIASNYIHQQGESPTSVVNRYRSGCGI